MTILYFIIALGLLIFIHEFGHFIVAKRAGICVEAFSLGFGPRILGIKWGDTDYRISLFPLGGYVKMRGEEPGEESATDPRSFSAKSVWVRAKVVFFGPLMNLILTLALMPIVFMIGRAEPVFLHEPPIITDIKAESPAQEAGLIKGDLLVSVDGKKVTSWENVLNKILLSPGTEMTFGVEREGRFVPIKVKVGDLPELRGGYVGVEPMLFIGAEPWVGEVRPGGSAEAAGIMPGDLVISFDGKNVYDWLDLTRLVNESGGKETTVVVQRDGNMLDLPVKAEFNEKFGRWIIGVTKDRMSGVPMQVQQYGFFGAIVRGTKENLKLAKLTFDVLGRLVTAKLSFKVIGGPVVIAKASAAAAASGFSNFLYFLAFLSMQLSILNFLPIPVLDGGQLVFLGWEAIRRKPLNMRIRLIAHQVGFFLLIGLMLLVTINDIDNVWGIKSLLKKFF
ncbi:MAG: RIP metalloprotease RseP [Pseudomonadota bacterium]